MRRRFLAFALLAAAMSLLPPISGRSALPGPTLITPEEAGLPPVERHRSHQRGLRDTVAAPGPKILLVSPQANLSEPLHHPFKIVLKFMPTDGARVDVGTLKVTYLRLFGIDITDRIRPFVSEQGINVDDPDIPPGDHAIRFQIGDTLGRMTTVVYHFVIGN